MQTTLSLAVVMLNDAPMAICFRDKAENVMKKLQAQYGPISEQDKVKANHRWRISETSFVSMQEESENTDGIVSA